MLSAGECEGEVENGFTAGGVEGPLSGFGEEGRLERYLRGELTKTWGQVPVAREEERKSPG